MIINKLKICRKRIGRVNYCYSSELNLFILTPKYKLPRNEGNNKLHDLNIINVPIQLLQYCHIFKSAVSYTDGKDMVFLYQNKLDVEACTSDLVEFVSKYYEKI